MINLIPSEEKKKIRKDFYIRLVIVSFLILAIAIIVSSFMLVPSLFYASLQKKLITESLNSKKDNFVLDLNQDAEKVVQSLENKIKIINDSPSSKFIISEKIINRILSDKIEGVTIDQIIYKNDPLKGKLLTLRGSAVSRDKLLTFKKNLENDVAFFGVDLPISNFIKSTDIAFNLTLIPYETK